jgi:hypothetical protein
MGAALAERVNLGGLQLPDSAGLRSLLLRQLMELDLAARVEHNFLQPLSTAQTAQTVV